MSRVATHLGSSSGLYGLLYAMASSHLARVL
jgi:hypothetical protein